MPGFKEFYVGQSDWYFRIDEDVIAKQGLPPGTYTLDEDKASLEHPDVFTFNGHKAALADPMLFGDAIHVAMGDKVRFFFVTLCNAIRHAAAVAEGSVVRDEHRPPDVRSGGAAPRPPLLRSLAEIEREHVLAVLTACRGCHAEAARVLGIGRNTLWRKLASYGSAASASASGAGAGAG